MEKVTKDGTQKRSYKQKLILTMKMQEIFEKINKYPIHHIQELANEDWVDIFGDSKYFVSSHGRVLNADYGRYKHPDILKGVKNNKGYLRVCLSANGNLKRYFIHRLVATAFINNIYNFNQVNHIDGVKTNNNINNLEWCNNSNNQRHAVMMGLRKRIATNSQYKRVTELEKDGNVIKFSTEKAAAKYLNYTPSVFRNRAKLGKTCRGYTVRFLERWI